MSVAKQPLMERPLNPWDILIGFCYGVQVTCVSLRLAGLVDWRIFVGCQLVFLAGLVLQICRQWQSYKPDRP